MGTSKPTFPIRQNCQHPSLKTKDWHKNRIAQKLGTSKIEKELRLEVKWLIKGCPVFLSPY